MATVGRRSIYSNPSARSWTSTPQSRAELTAIANFHRSLPAFEATRLVSLDAVASELGVKRVFVKDEGSRWGLPSFKILGASWATHQAIVDLAKLPLDTNLDALSAAAKDHNVKLYAATDGNHGRAVARMAKVLGIEAVIYVPRVLDQATQDRIASEGARVIVVSGDYDLAVLTAFEEARSVGGTLIQDMAFDGYEVIPKGTVDGYSTMLQEIEEQLAGMSLHDNPSDHVYVTPIGVGSLGQAVVTYSKAAGRSSRVLAVEPDNAACLWKSLVAGESTAIETRNTIQSGMNCGTLSTSAWPILKAGVDASVTVSDAEAHEAVMYLKSIGVSAGPCGAASLAAIRHVAHFKPDALSLNKESVVVLICSEGSREYKIPIDVSGDDPIALTQNLVRINSSNPGLSSTPGAGETDIAEYIAKWLHHRDITVSWIEPVPGRPSVIGNVRGSGGGKSLMFNGHIDTVTLAGYDRDPLRGEIIDGAVHGRGSLDMKSGLAASLIATARAKASGTRGDIIFAGVADEENLSMGTEQVLAAGWRADGAIVSEPFQLAVVLSHKGFVWLEVNILGLASHGSRPDLGIDAICKAGYFLVELDKYSQQLLSGPKHPTLGTGTVHAGLVKGGEEPSSYPAKCTITIERRTVPGETRESVESHIRLILEDIAKSVPDFRYELRTTFARSPFQSPEDHPFVAKVLQHVGSTLGHAPVISSDPAWTDCALLSDAGIPAVLFGPAGKGLHAKTEYATVESINQVTEALTRIALDFCQ